MDVARRGRNAVVQLGVRTVVMRGITVLGTVVLARILSPADFGVFAVLVFWMALLLQFGDLGLGASLVQQDHDPTPDEIGSAWVAQQFLWIPIVSAVWLVAPLVTRLLGGVGPDFEWQLRAVSLTLATAALGGVATSMLQRELRFGLLAGIDVVQHFVFYVTAVVMALRGYGAWSFVTAVLVQAVVGALLVNIAWGRRPYFRFHRSIVRRQIGFGASYQAASIVSYSTSMATPLFGWLSGGVFGIGQLQFSWRIGQLAAVFDDIVGRVTFPAFSRLQGDRARLGRVVRDAIVLSTMGVVATQGWLVSVAPSLVPIVFGDKWAPAVVALQLFCLATLVTLPLRFLRSLAYSQGRARQGLVAIVIGTGSLLIVAPPLVLLLGLAGAGVAYLTAASISLLLFLRIERDTASYPLASVARLVLLALPAGAAAWLTTHVVPGLVGLICSGVVFVAIYGTLLLLFARPDLQRGIRILLVRGVDPSALAGVPLDGTATAVWADD